MSVNGSSNGGVAASAAGTPSGGNMFSRRKIASAQGTLLSTTRFRRGQLVAANDRTVAAFDEAQEAQTILEAEQLRTDPAEKRRGSLPVAVGVAIAVAVIDVLPAYWAAQALGEGTRDTQIVTFILVAGLTGFAALMSHFRNRREMRLFQASIFFTALLIIVQTGLRFRFLRVVTHANLLDATLQSGLLACITGGLVWIGYVKLVSAEPWPTYLLRRNVKKLQGQLDQLRGALKQAGDDYHNTFESLSHLEKNRVSQEAALAAQVKEELELHAQLMEEVHRASVSDGPVEDGGAGPTPPAPGVAS